ncbi:MAG TPA: FAD-dependent oxidoreductase [Solirubrobacteraceae bacterium]|nr:FAD-dependent oxidoreductase [Solirubrobacteraceae bacterium]
MLEHIWAPGRIGPLELPHRIVMGSMHLGLESIDPDGRRLARFYAERAAGGAALIVTGGSAVSRVGAGGVSYSFVNEEAEAAKLGAIPPAVHAEGGRVLLQLFHAGRYAFERSFGLQPVAPSAVFSPYSRCEPRALTEAEILETIEDFARGAARARELGFDGVEIMGSEGYLLSQFMAPATNQRTDAWGGDLDGRMRVPLAVAAAVRGAVGPEGAVVYRLSGADLVPGGASLEELIALARRLASGPADALNVGIGWHESRVPTVQSVVPPGAWSPWAGAVRAAVAVPVIASNRVNTASLADALVGDGLADFVSMARPFLADPRFVHRSRGGAGRVNVCIACNQCIDASIFDRRVSCAVNPRAGYELDGADEAAVGGAHVAVVGGGPAGMEAARALAAAGSAVTLFEAAEALGGQFRMACRIPGKEDFAQTGGHFGDELARLGVEVTLGRRVTADDLGGFDAVVVATGVRPRRVPIPGAELPHVLSYPELLLAEHPAALVGRRVAIIGAGGIGTDIAHLLSAHDGFYERYGLEPPARAASTSPPVGQIHTPGGIWPTEAERPAQITLMRRGGRIGDGVGASTRWVVVQELQRAGVELLTGIEYERIERDAVLVRVGGDRRRIPADTVILAAGQEAERSLADALAARGRPHVVIGGAAGAVALDAGRAFRDGLESPARVRQALAAAG